MRKTAGLILLCLAFAFLSWSLVRASSSLVVRNVEVLTHPMFPPPIPLDDEPVAIPDSPFIERYGDKYTLFLLLANAFHSTPESYNWNPAVDFNFDNVVNMCDAIVFAKNR